MQVIQIASFRPYYLSSRQSKNSKAFRYYLLLYRIKEEFSNLQRRTGDISIDIFVKNLIRIEITSKILTNLISSIIDYSLAMFQHTFY